MENKQTAVEWLMEEWPALKYQLPAWLVEQAKAMQKEQIEEAYLNGCSRVTPYGYYNDSAKQYYNETYGS